MSYRSLVFTMLTWATLYASGCAYGTLACPKEGGATWHEVQSKNFILKTNLSRGEALERSREFENMHHALAHVIDLDFPRRGTATDPIEIIHFAHHEQLDNFVGETVGGFMTRRNGTVIIVSSESRNKEQRNRLLLHELTHRFVDHSLSSYPSWLTEGVAGFFESLKVQGGKARVGLLPSNFRDMWFHNSSMTPSIRELRAMNHDAFYKRNTKHANYFAAWRLVHYLSNSSPAMNRRFHIYAAALVQGMDESSAWDQVFGDLPSLESDVREYRGSRAIMNWLADYTKPKAGAPEIRKLSDGEVHVLWARTSKISFGRPKLRAANEKRLAKQLNQAQEHEPDWQASTFWRIDLEDGELEERRVKLRAYLAEHPGDLIATKKQFELDVESLHTGGMRPALRALSLEALLPVAEKLAGQAVYGRDHLLLARYWVAARKPEAGLAFAMTSIERSPNCVRCYVTLGMLLNQSGDHKKAIAVQKHAIALYGERGGAHQSEFRRLQHYEDALIRQGPSAP